jgi:hypothetical protein
VPTIDLVSVNGERNHEMENSYLSFFFYVTNIKKNNFIEVKKKIAQHYIAYNNTNLMNYVVVGNNLLIKM